MAAFVSDFPTMHESRRSLSSRLLRELRDSWLGEVLDLLRDDDTVVAAGLVGSLGRGDDDDWSDIDLLIVVPDTQVARFVDARELPRADDLRLSFDARHNAPRHAGAVSGEYVIDGLPLWVDWYIYPASEAGWATDATVVFDRQGLPDLAVSFADHLAGRDIQPATVKAPDEHERLRAALIPIAAKHVVRRSPQAAKLMEFVGGPPAPEAAAAEQLDVLRQLLFHYSHRLPDDRRTAIANYLDLVGHALSAGEPQ
ncbi:nucleotidyltransferase domain-containing protein [Nakamurella lactea]|uniref:nucleotidyltransferase domain-containing protein n=1 Tax=Nakamurella lactea TaxID=459515 RepID=UPI0003FB8A50|nr:nucleotidyltransferase domain-containing protein [Nakamurella lactea]